MGFAKRLLEEIESRGAHFLPDKYVCADCLDDYALKAIVVDNAEPRRCSYCGQTSGSVPLDDIVEVVVAGFSSEYDDPANELGFCSAEGGYLGATIHTCELVWRFSVTHREQLADDVSGALVNSLWCRKDYYGLPYDERLRYGWAKFAEKVKHENHFFPTQRGKGAKREYLSEAVDPAELLNVLEEILEALGLVRTLPKGTRFVRARKHPAKVSLHTADDLGPPPAEEACLPNRMSPAGVPMFYGAIEEETSLAEIEFPDSALAATVATFETTRKISVVDLSELPDVPSLFDLDRNALRPRIRFLHACVTDFSKPITRDQRQHVEYVPTQYVTAFIQNRMRGNIKGVLYPSSRVEGGTSCVLFFNAEECREVDRPYRTTSQYLRLLPQSIRRISPTDSSFKSSPRSAVGKKRVSAV